MSKQFFTPHVSLASTFNHFNVARINPWISLADTLSFWSCTQHISMVACNDCSHCLVSEKMDRATIIRDLVVFWLLEESRNGLLRRIVFG